jgi:hypothetical protein
MEDATDEGTLINMACGCGGAKASNLYNIEVTFRDGSKKVFGSKAEARIAIAGLGGGGTMKNVLKSENPVTK